MTSFPIFPDIAPSLSTSANTNYAVLTAQFGDGYRQDAPDGLNNIRQTWDVIWENIVASEIATIKAFLDARAGAEPFCWTPPDETSPRTFKCPDGIQGPTFNGYQPRTIRATFVEAFDIP